MQSPDGGPVKIGYSINLDARRRHLEWYYGRSMALLGSIPGGRKEEKEIHARFAHLRFGKTEQFRPTAELMEFIGRPLLVSANPDAVEVMETLTRVRLDVDPDEHLHLRMAAAVLNLSMAAYVKQLVREDMKRKPKP